MASEIMQYVGRMLIKRKLTIAFAESATAGRLCAEFSMIKNAGNFLKGCIACYDASIKEDLLQVSHSLIEKFSPESIEVTRAITNGLSQVILADIHIGITGLTSPGGSESPEKPVGTMFIYATLKGEVLFSHRECFTGNRENIVYSTVIRCAELLEEHLK